MAIKPKDTIIVDGDNAEEITIGGTEEITMLSPELQKKVEQINEEVNIVTPSEDKPIIQKMVKVKMRVDHKCNVGGEWYYLIKGKQFNVPENVKEILLASDLLLPL